MPFKPPALLGFSVCALTAALLLFINNASGHNRALPRPPVQMDVKTVTLTHLDADGLTARIEFSAIANNSGTLGSLVFERVTVNGVAVRVAPIRGPLRLKEGHAIEGLSSFDAALSYRDLETLDPVRGIIQSGKAVVHAVMRGQLELTFIEKLVLFTGGAWAVTEFDHDVPVQVPGGLLGRLAAMATLTAAEPIWTWGQSGKEWRRQRSETAVEAKSGMSGQVVALDTSYQLQLRNSKTIAIHTLSSGVLIGDGKVLSMAEAIEPWRFQEAVAEALANDEVTLQPERVEILAQLATSTGEFLIASLQQKEIRIAKVLSGTNLVVSLKTKRRYHVSFRDSDENAVMLVVLAWKGRFAELRLASGPNSGAWQPAAVYRPKIEGQREPAIFMTEARWENGRYRLRDSLDPAFFGSAVWMVGGVAGLLQDEDSAGDFREVLRKLK